MEQSLLQMKQKHHEKKLFSWREHRMFSHQSQMYIAQQSHEHSLKWFLSSPCMLNWHSIDWACQKVYPLAAFLLLGGDRVLVREQVSIIALHLLPQRSSRCLLKLKLLHQNPTLNNWRSFWTSCNRLLVSLKVENRHACFWSSSKIWHGWAPPRLECNELFRVCSKFPELKVCPRSFTSGYVRFTCSAEFCSCSFRDMEGVGFKNVDDMDDEKRPRLGFWRCTRAQPHSPKVL